MYFFYSKAEYTASKFTMHLQWAPGSTTTPPPLASNVRDIYIIFFSELLKVFLKLIIETRRIVSCFC